jgi:AraC-like DNA-binding protein
MSGFADSEKPLEMQGISSSGLAESCARQRATRPDAAAAPKDDLLGEPLTISEVARVFGCSVWTVRHAYLPQGLPHFRSGPSGKLVFFHKQVVQWILQQQEKGGI